jgi:hypothetical protein
MDNQVRSSPRGQGVRFDFQDQRGQLQTRYLEYRPFGVDFEPAKPRIKSYTFNSYAKAKAVEIGWDLVRVGQHDVDKEQNLTKVKQLIDNELRHCKVWPLKLEFQVPLAATGSRTMKEWSSDNEVFHITKKPLGFEFQKDRAPVVVQKVYPGSYAAEAGIKEGWRIVRIADVNVEGFDYKQVKAKLEEGVADLDTKPGNGGGGASGAFTKTSSGGPSAK